MNTTKLIGGVAVVGALGATMVYLEWELLVDVGVGIALFATVSGLGVVISALGAAPDGEEHGVRTKTVPKRSRRVRLRHPITARTAA